MNSAKQGGSQTKNDKQNDHLETRKKNIFTKTSRTFIYYHCKMIHVLLKRALTAFLYDYVKVSMVNQNWIYKALYTKRKKKSGLKSGIWDNVAILEPSTTKLHNTTLYSSVKCKILT